MSKKCSKLMLISILCVSLIVPFANQAYSARLGGSFAAFQTWSIHLEELVKGIGSSIGENAYEVCASIGILEAQLRCMNHGGQDGGLGSPFYPDDIIDITLSSVITSADLIGKGKAWLDISYSDQLMIYVLDQAGELPDPADVCVNPNWTFFPDWIQVNEMYVYLGAYSPDGNDADTDPDLDDSECYYCTYPSTDPNAEPGAFDCTEVSVNQCQSLGLELCY
jgi:hypothetical protein